MARWEAVYSDLQRKAEQLGYSPPVQLGSSNSQTFEFRTRGRPVLLIAFRDLGRKPDYSMPNRLWRGSTWFWIATRNCQRRVRRRPAIAVVIDNIGDSYAVVTMDELLQLYLERVKKPHSTAVGSSRFR